MGKPLKEVSKKGAAHAAFMARRVEIVLTQPGKEPEKSEYTVKGLVEAVVDLNKELATLRNFVSEVTLCFYQAAPQDAFFIKQGPAFVAYVKETLEQNKTRADLAVIEAALKDSDKKEEAPANALPFPEPEKKEDVPLQDPTV
jgi:hypothetical protein